MAKSSGLLKWGNQSLSVTYLKLYLASRVASALFLGLGSILQWSVHAEGTDHSNY